jgi:hypothetical protein
MMTRTSGGSTVNVLRALSWNISFPRFRRFEGQPRSADPQQAEPVLPGPGRRRRRRAVRPPPACPTSQVRYRRLYVNGGYYDYALDIEVPGEDMLKRTTRAGQRVGDLFKASGNSGTEEGPWGRGDAQPLANSCVGRHADLRAAGALHRHLRAQDLGLEDGRRHPVADRRA